MGAIVLTAKYVAIYHNPKSVTGLCGRRTMSNNNTTYNEIMLDDESRLLRVPRACQNSLQTEGS